MRCSPANRRAVSRNTRYRSCPPALAVITGPRRCCACLEKATQIRPDNRYQTVQEFWDDLADATLPPTQTACRACTADSSGSRTAEFGFERRTGGVYRSAAATSLRAGHRAAVRRASAESTIRSVTRYAAETEDCGAGNHDAPKAGSVTRRDEGSSRKPARDRIAALPDQARNGNGSQSRRSKHAASAVSKAPGTRRARPFLVAAVLILAFLRNVVGDAQVCHFALESFCRPAAAV